MSQRTLKAFQALSGCLAIGVESLRPLDVERLQLVQATCLTGRRTARWENRATAV